MIHDVVVNVTCDGCDDVIEIEPSFVYPDYSGKNGYYDTRDSALEKKIEKAGWTVDGDQHFCDLCSEDEDYPEEAEEEDETSNG